MWQLPRGMCHCYKHMLTVTSDAILDAAYEELLNFGLRRVSVEDIAKKVGVARITIYRRFANRDELLMAVAIREGQRLFEQVDRAIERHATLDEQIVEGFAVLFHAVRNHPIVQRTLTSEPELATELLSTNANAIIAFARDYAAARLQITPAAAEVMVRLSASLILAPESSIPLKTANDARKFARTFLLPMVSQ